MPKSTPKRRSQLVGSCQCGYKPSWVPSWMAKHGTSYARYPKVSIAAWHEQEGWPVTVKP